MRSRIGPGVNNVNPSRIFTIVALILALFIVAPGCKNKGAAPAAEARTATPEPPTGPRRNLVVITIDSLRADHLGSYGYQPPTSPRLDRFAAENIRFERAYATSPWTLPSHASLFTGLYADTHGAQDEKARLLPNAYTLATHLKTRGYATGAVVCAPLLAKYFGLDTGFDTYDDDLISLVPLKARRMKVAPDVTNKALAWIDEKGDQPFFLFLHYWDVHHDYNPPQEYVELFDPDYQGTEQGLDITIRGDLKPGMPPRDLEHIVALYDGEIRYTDDYLGKLLDGMTARGLDENTMIWITSDHGEEFLEHGQMAHKKTCYEESIRIPMLARIPWIDATAKLVDEPVSLVDIFPTVLGFLGDNANGAPLQGVDLSDYLTRGKRVPTRPILAATTQGRVPGRLFDLEWDSLLTKGGSKLHAVRGPRKHATPKLMLFDLVRDPGEQDDVATRQKSMRGKLGRALRKRKAAHTKLHDALGIAVFSEDALDPDLAETLKGLGYLQ
jgi:arylsulfatase A-like enzyme